MNKKTSNHSPTLLMAGLFSLASFMAPSEGHAQLSSNPDKFLGNITTSYNVDWGNEKYYTLWNQITPENESKWSSIEGSRRGSFNWGGCDNAYNYAKRYGFPFKFHCLIWGAQYPGWMDNLSTEEQYKAIVEWMDAIKARYPDLPLIDVVNEAIPGHQPAPYKEALGGDGKTGYDWIIKAFEMAYERWPDAILIYNDYNTFQWQRTEFINLVKVLRDAGAPIDAYGCQSHDLTGMNLTDFKSAMTEIQNALKMPMYSTEYDIGTTDDNLQLQRYKEQIPYMWEADYCAGITLWGYIYGRTWIKDDNTGEGGISGIIKDGKDRPAMTWLREYMQTDKAKNAKSPYPGMVKEASVYIKPAKVHATKGESLPIEVRARMKTKTIDHVDLYVKNKYCCTLTEAPYVAEYTPTVLGRHELKAVVVTTDSTKYERIGAFTAYNPRTTFQGVIELPGTLQAENFDVGGEGVSYHDTDTRNEGTTAYRSNGGGVDIVNGNGGYAIGYTATGEWLEYSVDVKKAGLYSFDAYVSSGATTSSISLMLNTDNAYVALTNPIGVPCVTPNNWDTYQAVHGRMLVKLEEGKQILRINITGGSCNIDKIVFNHIEVDENIKVDIEADSAPATVNEITTIKVNASSSNGDIESVRFYLDDILLETVTSQPFEMDYKPTATGNYNIKAVAVDKTGKESNFASYTLIVNHARTPYKGVIDLPGIIEMENFDKGGENFSFHDSDNEDKGKSNYRTDNEGVDIVKRATGYVVAYTAAGEWLEYTVNVTEPGKYAYEATVASTATGAKFSIGLMKGTTVLNLATVSVPQTGSIANYQVVNGNLNLSLSEGKQVIRIRMINGDFRLDKIELKCTMSTGVEEIVDGHQQESDVMYNMQGIRVNENYRGLVIKNGRKVLLK